mmetsp:Transcript_45575/g.75982  ORF Transcript_45575/g.75982 Transcript_45575/m.75982 type:complete len:226 (+) Transcript_45575:674-1351(+)
MRLVRHPNMDWRTGDIYTAERSHEGVASSPCGRMVRDLLSRARLLHVLLGIAGEHHHEGHRVDPRRGGGRRPGPHPHEHSARRLGVHQRGGVWADAGRPLPVCGRNAQRGEVSGNFLPGPDRQRGVLGHPGAQHPRLHALRQVTVGPARGPGDRAPILHGGVCVCGRGRDLRHRGHLRSAHRRPRAAAGAHRRPRGHVFRHPGPRTGHALHQHRSQRGGSGQCAH